MWIQCSCGSRNVRVLGNDHDGKVFYYECLTCGSRSRKSKDIKDLSYRVSNRPRYVGGERYCSICNIVAGRCVGSFKCPECGRPMRSSPRKGVSLEKRVYIEVSV